jgi:hypothetical protein
MMTSDHSDDGPLFVAASSKKARLDAHNPRNLGSFRKIRARFPNRHRQSGGHGIADLLTASRDKFKAGLAPSDSKFLETAASTVMT